MRGIRANLYDPEPLPVQNDRAPYDPASIAGGTGTGQPQGRYDPVQAIARDLAE